jgi:citrate lyase subunit beta/citryl-CoA lyase
VSAWLFVPGDRPDRFDKAVATGADEVVLDLEDAVSPGAKGAARTAVAGWLAAGGRAWVRVNGQGTPWHAADLDALAGLTGLSGVVVPKAESPEALAAVGARLPGRAGLVALVETARGISDVQAVAACPAVSRLAFGSIDYCADLGAEVRDDVLLLPRSLVVLASRTHGKPAPVDGVTLDLTDQAAAGADAARARAFGFGGKLCIHPTQVAPVQGAFAPTGDELAWAREVVAADRSSGGAATAVRGALVDGPVVRRAQQLLDRAAG